MRVVSVRLKEYTTAEMVVAGAGLKALGSAGRRLFKKRMPRAAKALGYAGAAGSGLVIGGLASMSKAGHQFANRVGGKRFLPSLMAAGMAGRYLHKKYKQWRGRESLAEGAGCRRSKSRELKVKKRVAGIYESLFVEGRFSKYGRGFLSREVGEKKGRQVLHSARKALHAAGGASNKAAFGDYLAAKRGLVARLKQKKMMATSGIKSRRNLNKAVRDGQNIMQSVMRSASHKPGKAYARNAKLVGKLAGRMGVTGVGYKPTDDPNYAAGAARSKFTKSGGEQHRVISAPKHAMRAAVAAHEIGHLKAKKGLTKLIRRHARMERVLPRIPESRARKELTGVVRSALGEEIKANRAVSREFKMNRRNRKRMQGAMSTYMGQVSGAAQMGAMPMGKYLKTQRQYKKAARNISQLSRRTKEGRLLEGAAAAAVKAASAKRKTQVQKQKNRIRLVKAVRKMSESQPLLELSASLLHRAKRLADARHGEALKTKNRLSNTPFVRNIGTGKSAYHTPGQHKTETKSTMDWAKKKTDKYARMSANLNAGINKRVKSGLTRHNPTLNARNMRANSRRGLAPQRGRATLTGLGKAAVGVAGAYGAYRAGKWALGKAKNLYNRVRYGAQ